MDLKQLRYFVAIVDSCSLSQASMQLRVAQPALSQHVRRMEEELHTSLLDRTHRGVTPTEAGRRLYTSARRILSQMTDLPEFVLGSVKNPTGDVRFGMSGTVNELIGVPLLEQAKDRYPGIRVRIVEAMSGHVMDWIRRGEVDVALIYATSHPKDVEIKHILTEDLYLFGRPDGPVAVPSGGSLDFSAVTTLDLIVNGPSHGLRELVEDATASISAQIKPVFEVDSYNQIKRLVRSGKGYGILPKTAIADDIKAGIFSFWKIERPALRRNIYLAHSSGKSLSSAGQAISALADEIAVRLVHEGQWLAKIAVAP